MIIQPLKKFKILVVGDLCDDVYQYGEVDRLSPEAPVPVFKISHTITKPGMAANVAENLKNLGCEVTSIVGSKSTKTRLIDSRSGQHITRIDNDVISSVAYVPSFYYDSIVFSDYDKGVVSYELIQDTRRRFKGPIFVDTKKTDLRRLEGCFVKVNEPESKKLETECSDLIITRGSNPVTYQNCIFTVPKTEVVDVCGAGDTFISSLCFYFLHSNNIKESIKFAIKAASITVKHQGVYAPTIEEVT